MPEPEHTPHALHLIRDETLLHTAADGLKKAAHYLSSIRPKLYPGSSVLLRPNSPWLYRAAGALKAVAPILEHGGIVADVMTSTNNTPGSSWERESNKTPTSWQRAQEAQRTRELSMTPKVEQGIPFKDGTIYWPKSKHWDFRPTVITPLSPTHNNLNIHKAHITPSSPFGKINPPSFGHPTLQLKPQFTPNPAAAPGGLRLNLPRVGQSLPFKPMKPSTLGRFQLGTPVITAAHSRVTPLSAFGKLNPSGFGHPTLQLKPQFRPKPPVAPSGFKLSLPRIGQSLPFKPMRTPSLGAFQLRPPSMRFR